MGIDFRMTAHTGIEQQRATRVLDDVTKTRLDPRSAGTRLFGRSDEVAEIDAAHRCFNHALSLSVVVRATIPGDR